MRCLLIVLCLLPLHALAGPKEIVERALETHVLPAFETLADRADALARVAEADCTPGGAALITAYGDAFDAWIAASYLRFGPTEVDNRAFALAFWPDPRASTPKTLRGLIASEDPVVASEETFSTVSIAARGFHALERLMFDPEIRDAGDPGYACALLRAVARDIDETATAISADWRGRYADLMRGAGTGESPYANHREAIRELYKALGTGLQFTSEARLGRPLGTFDRPRPTRAEARLSGRSLRHVLLSLEATEALAMILADGDPGIDEALREAYADARDAGARVDDPVFASVDDPAGRLKVEVLQQRIEHIREVVRATLGPALGVDQGFNALDGD